MLVTNVSLRPYYNVGGVTIVPGQTIDIDERFEVDIKDNKDLQIVKSEIAVKNPKGWKAE